MTKGFRTEVYVDCARGSLFRTFPNETAALDLRAGERHLLPSLSYLLPDLSHLLPYLSHLLS
jgi:hypothetical protein